MAFRFFQHVPQARRLWVRSIALPRHGLFAHLQHVVAMAEVRFEHEPSSTLEHLAGQFGLSDALVGQPCGFSRQAMA